MTDTLALIYLYDAVVERFALEGLCVPNSFGWREPAKKVITGDRIAWIPGDEGGSLGELLPARNPGGNARSIGTLGELFTCEITAFDRSDATNERAQYKAARFLFDAWYRAVYLAARGTFQIVSSEWIKDKKEQRAGAGIRVVCAVQAMIPDEKHPYAPTESRADVDVTKLDLTEGFVTPANVRVSTTGPIALFGIQTIDGVLLSDGDRVLVKDQIAGSSNGSYVAASGAWTRSDDANISAEVVNGLSFAVNEGAENGGSEFELTTPNPIVLGTTALVFTRKA